MFADTKDVESGPVADLGELDELAQAHRGSIGCRQIGSAVISPKVNSPISNGRTLMPGFLRERELHSTSR